MFDWRSYVTGIVLMLKKFTLIDINKYEEVRNEDYASGIMLLPVLGLAIGFFACFISAFRLFYDSFFISIIEFAFYCIITKNVNLTDTYRTLNYIIKPKNGSEQISGIIGIILICLLYIILLKLVKIEAVIVAMSVGYCALIVLSGIFERNKDGTSIMAYCTRNHIIVAFVISFGASALINYKLVVPLSLTYMLSGMIVSLIDKNIKILPYSIEGFIIETTQILFLILTYIFKIK